LAPEILATNRKYLLDGSYNGKINIKEADVSDDLKWDEYPYFQGYN